ncbi:esterase [Thalassotalea insulae]|uniref:Esterase n=1 Tax=Thalassotalea insulae TaxID=2056778 RepID=A0ABQ6GUU6_9GAMM|nr:alpha/beta hydrolase-fold protein [Thalassotalea insulae]GLX79454.1 esterase [Thalassotalea insulae]
MHKLIKINQRLIAVFFTLLSCIGVQANEAKLYSMPRTQVVPIKDSQSNKQYELLIKLPEHYAENKEKKYPVIYFTDAVWHIELLSSASFFIMEDVILVGISWQKDIAEDLTQQYGEHFSRYGDYSFKQTINPKHPNIKFGQAKSHLAFIRNDVFNYVEKHYRTEPTNRSYFGFSAGGLFGAYILMTQPDSFKNYLLGSPSIWRNGPELIAQESAALKSAELEINVFISYGELEKELSLPLEAFISTLKNNHYQGISSLKHIVVGASGHSDSSPLMAIQSVKWLKSLQSKEGE